MKFHDIFSFWHSLGFHGRKFLFFFTPTFFVFTGGIWRKISRGLLIFHGQFPRNFHGKENFLTGGYPKIFTGRIFFFFSPEKKTLGDLAFENSAKNGGTLKRGGET